MNVKNRFVLFYETAPDYLERREQYRSEHLDMIQAGMEKGSIIMGGALSDPADLALLVFDTKENAEAFASSDPYVAHGVVISWYIRTWSVLEKQ